MGCMGYADDVIIIRPTVTALKIMIQIVDKFGEEYNVKFNPDKCKLLCYNNGTGDGICRGITHNGVYISAEQSASHLGNTLGTNL